MVNVTTVHRFLVAMGWGILVVALGSTVACSSWLHHVRFKNLVDYEVMSISADGRWLTVRAHTKKHPDVVRRYLLSTDGRRRISLPLHPGSWPWTRFSKDGNRAAWWHGTESTGWTLWFVDLGGRDPSFIETSITVSTFHGLTLSPEGKRVALLGGGAISVYDLELEELITRVPVSREMSYGNVSFLDRDRLRLAYSAHNDRLEPYAGDSTFFYDLAIEDDAQLQIVSTFPYPRDVNHECDREFRILISGGKQRNYGSTEIQPQRIYSVETGQLIREVNGFFRGFLADGRMWSISEGESGDLEVVIEQPDGEGPTALSIGPPGRKIVVGFGANGGLMVASDPIPQRDHPQNIWASIEMIDLDTGRARQIGQSLKLSGIRKSNLRSGRSTGFHSIGSVFGYPTSAGESLLFINADNDLLGWDPAQDKLVTLVRGSAHRSSE